MTAWQIYWVMQLDAIRGFLSVISIFALMASLMLGSLGFLFNDQMDHPSDRQNERWNVIRSITTRIIVAAAVVAAANVALPTTRTAAAMIVLPTITSDTVREAVAPEARELYQLAKDALRHAAGKDEPKKD
jgi:4-hydroxybenzoate polyprenyltransferase